MTGPTRRPVVVHDFFVTEGGADHCAIEFARLIPSARVVTSFFDVDRFGERIDPRRVRTWPPQRLVGPTRHFRALLPLYPIWFGRMDVGPAPLVVSSSIAFSHAVRNTGGGVHVSYVYTPMRYAWDLESYLEGSSISLASRLGARTIRPLLRRWDVATAGRPDIVVAISNAVSERISRFWGRSADEVIFPPVDTEQIKLGSTDDGFLLVAARLLAYRRIDLAVDAATRLGRKLIVVGEGPERTRLEAAAGPTVTFVGQLDRGELIDLFKRCHAYLVPGVEDFGIAPVEAMAAGKPVVAFRAGGALDTVVDGATGAFFDDQTVDATAAAIKRVDGLRLDPAVMRARAEEFSREVFLERWRALFRRFGVDPSLYSAE